MARVYISSTYQDLKPFRAAVSRSIRKLDHVDVSMEYYVAEPLRPLDRCLDDVHRCDLYVGLFARRYGFVPAGYDRSITELEYREALKAEKPALCFLLDSAANWPAEFEDSDRPREQLEALLFEIKRDWLAGFFSSSEGLAADVTAAIARWSRDATTPVDPDREHRLITAWRTSANRIERNRARQALVNMGSPRYAAAVKELVLQPQLRVDERHFYLEELLHVCANSDEAMPILVDLLQGTDPSSQRMAIFNIGELGLKGRPIKPRIVREIIDRAHDRSPEVRGEVAHTLSKIRHAPDDLVTVTACLERLTNDSNAEVRERAGEALDAISP